MSNGGGWSYSRCNWPALSIITSIAKRPTTPERGKKAWDVGRPIPHVIPPLERLPMVYRISSNERTDRVNPTGHRRWGDWVPCDLKCATRDQEVGYRSPVVRPFSPLQLSWLSYSLQFLLGTILSMADPPDRWWTRYDILLNRYHQHLTLTMLDFPP